MLLSEEDIELIKIEGYRRDQFVRLENGYTFLRNYQGHCVFYCPEDASCLIYKHRPVGCRLYPVIYDEDKGVEVIDDICCARDTISKKEKKLHGRKVVNLLKKIDKEAESRLSS
jgi:Fe-S-cluster containining protein